MKNIKKLLSILLLVPMIAGCKQKEEVITQDLGPFQARQLPSLWCDYFYMIDQESGQVLLDIRSDEMMYPASMTKVMTSIIALEEIEDPASVVIPFTQEMMDGLKEAGANRAGFVVGDEPTALDHIYGDLLPSGADCSRALAFYISGSEEAFVELMNQKAKELGMEDTHFVNTSGLHDDDHYTTCQDMMKLYLYCLENPVFTEMIQTQKHVSVPVEHYPDGLGMDNFVLIYINQEDPQYTYNFDVEGFIGGKSGYTIEGQYTLVSNAEINGMKLALVNAHGYNQPHYPASIEDAAVLYNWYREHYEKKTVVAQGEAFGSIRVRNTLGEEVEIAAAQTYTGIVPSDDNLHIVVKYEEVVEGPIAQGQQAGTVEIYNYDELLTEIPLVYTESRSVSGLGKLQTELYEMMDGRVWIISVGLLGLIVIVLICEYRSKMRKR